jgi:putative membrane protein
MPGEAGRTVDREGRDPDYRFSLANERTFLAWIRTALGLLAGGVAVVALLDDVGSVAMRLAVGATLLLLAVLLPPLAYRRWSATEAALRTGESLPEPGLLRLVAGGLVVVTVLVAVLVLV